MVIRICRVLFFFSVLSCFSGVVLSSPYKTAFLADKARNGKYQVCIYIPVSVKCMTNHIQGVSRFWKLYPPYLAYEVKSEERSTIYFLNLRTGIAAKKATISSSGVINNLWVSPSGDRVLSIEKAPFGNLLVSQGIYLDTSYQIIQKVSSNISIVGWTFPADIAYLKDSNMKSVIALSLNDGKNKEILHSFDENEDIIDVSVSSTSKSTSFAVSWKRDNKYSLEIVIEGVRKVVANSSYLYSPNISDDGHKIVYIEKQSDRKNVINIFNNETKNTTEYFVVDYEINNLILLSGY